MANVHQNQAFVNRKSKIVNNNAIQPNSTQSTKILLFLNG